MKITLIGLGTDDNDLTLKGKIALDNATKIFARTALTKSFKSLQNYQVESLDYLFERSRNFDTLNKKLAKTVLDCAKEQNVVYCVDGAVCEDIACKIILSRSKNVEVIEGVSKLANASSLAKLKSVQVSGISAYDINNLKPCHAAVVYDIDGAYIASQVKVALSDLFGEESPCTFICENKPKKIKIYEIDRQKSIIILAPLRLKVINF